jgi:hypothetical protein
VQTLTAVRQLLSSRRAKRTSDVFDAARVIARGGTVDPDDLLQAVTLAGMTDDDFADLVDMIERRDGFRKTVQGRAAIDQELAILDETLAKHDRELEAAKTKHRQAVEPLHRQREEAASRLVAVGTAEAELTAPQNLPPALVSRLEEARKTLHRATSAVRTAQAEVDRQTSRAEDAFKRLEADGGFARAHAAWKDETRRNVLGLGTQKLVEDVVYGRHRAEEHGRRLREIEAEADAAQAAFAAAEKACRDF